MAGYRRPTTDCFLCYNISAIDYLGVDDEDVPLVDAVVLVEDVEEHVEQRAAADLGGGF